MPSVESVLKALRYIGIVAAALAALATPAGIAVNASNATAAKADDAATMDSSLIQLQVATLSALQTQHEQVLTELKQLRSVCSHR